MISRRDAKIDDLLSTLWQRNLPTLYERLDLLDRAASVAASGKLPESLRVEALDIAHKLSGSLGMFGYSKGTEIARRIEQILTHPIPATLGQLAMLAKNLRQVSITKS
jgi:HPt (histidine-containing phosphotransfer) domain-containing protein